MIKISPFDDMSLEEYKAISPVFEEDIYEAISMKTCVEMRNTIGAPGKKCHGAGNRTGRSIFERRIAGLLFSNKMREKGQKEDGKRN